jgi:hypothetical protein
MKFAKEPGFADIGMDMPTGDPEPANTTVQTGYLDGRTGDFGQEALSPTVVPTSTNLKKGILLTGALIVVAFLSTFFFGGSGYRASGIKHY